MKRRRCPACGGVLVWIDGEEESARERGGNARERDTFRCDGCPRLYRHSVSERFSGDIEWWGVKENAEQADWVGLPDADYPKFR